MATKGLSIEEIDEQIKKLQEAKEAIKKEAKEKLEKEKAERKAEVDEALNKYLSLRDAYVKDYGYFYTKTGTTSKVNPSDLFLDFFS